MLTIFHIQLIIAYGILHFSDCEFGDHILNCSLRDCEVSIIPVACCNTCSWKSYKHLTQEDGTNDQSEFLNKDPNKSHTHAPEYNDNLKKTVEIGLSSSPTLKEDVAQEFTGRQ